MTSSAPGGSALLVEQLEGLRGPLTRHCYRLLGAAGETDDAVQESLIRAVGQLHRFDPRRARLSTWVHAIATNVCLDMLRRAGRRALPVDLGPAAAAVGPGVALPAERWVEPMPDGPLLAAADPADVVTARETVRLAFVAALQRLPPRQRAVLVLRDVLDLSAQEVAEVLDTTVAAVNSALQRARGSLAADPPQPEDLVAPDDPRQQELLRRYIAAFQSHDVVRLTALLRADAIASMPPLTWQLRGGARIAGLMAASDACARDRLLPVAINGGPGLGQYRPDADGVLRPFALVALQVRGGLIAHVTTFLGTGPRFAAFGLPADPATVAPAADPVTGAGFGRRTDEFGAGGS